VYVQQSKDCEYRSVSERIDGIHGDDLIVANRHNHPRRTEEKFQRVRKIDDRKEQNEIEHDRRAVDQTIAAKESVLDVPNLRQHRERPCERGKSRQHVQQFVERARDLERNNEQGDRKPEDGVAKPLDS